MYALLIVVLLMVLLVEEEEDALALVTLPSAEANAVLCTNGAAALFPQPTGASLPDDDALPNPPSFAFFARLTLCATGFSLSQYTFNPPSFLLLLLFLLDFDVDAFLPELLVVLLQQKQRQESPQYSYYHSRKKKTKKKARLAPSSASQYPSPSRLATSLVCSSSVTRRPLPPLLPAVTSVRHFHQICDSLMHFQHRFRLLPDR